jgi:hypothetical protein
MSRHAPRFALTLLDKRQSLPTDRPVPALRRSRLPLMRSCSLQRFPACAVPSERPRSKRSRRDVLPSADPRQPTACVLAVFSPWRFDDQSLIVSDRRITVRCASFVADVLMGLCAVPGTLRGLSQPGRDFPLANAPGIYPSQCFSGPWVSAPFGVSRPQSFSRPAFTAHVFGRSIRCCGSKPSRLRLGGVWPRGQAVLMCPKAPLKLGYEGPLRSHSQSCHGFFPAHHFGSAGGFAPSARS